MTSVLAEVDRAFAEALAERRERLNVALIERAFEFSNAAHRGQKRLSGHDYISHAVEVAKILVDRQLDSVTIASALLHDVVEDADVTVEEARRVLTMSRFPISLDRPVGNSEDSQFGDLLPDGTAESPQIGATQEMLRDRISNVLKSLSYREREIIKLRYGLGDGYSYTLEEVGRKMGVTRERVRQIEAQALSRLRHPTVQRKLREYLG